MRISRLSALAVMATLALAPAANAMPQDLHPADSQDTAVQQDLAHLRAGGSTSSQDGAALAQEKYYSSYGKARPLHRSAPASDDGSPVAAVALSLVLIAAVAGSVAVAVRTRRRSVRLAV
jgi:hypothetical protein